MGLTLPFTREDRILITGGGGYLGSMLASMIAPSGATCLLLDRRFNERSMELASSFPHVLMKETDLTDRSGLSAICRSFSPDHVFHFAASLDRTRDITAYDTIWQANVGGTLNLLEALRDVSYKSFIFSGTSDVYGTLNPLPFHEGQTPDPLTPYAITKMLAEQEISGWSKLHAKPFTVCRIFLFIGPGMPPATFVGQLMQAIADGTEFVMTPGLQKRDYLFIDDLLYSMMYLAASGSANGEVVNICSGTSVSMNDLVEMVFHEAGVPVRVKQSLPYREQEIWEIRGSNEKLKRLFPAFNPVPLQTAIQNLLKK